MAMNPATLKTALKATIISKLEAKFALTDAGAIAARDDTADAIAEAVATEVIAHIQANAVITTSVAVGSVTLVAPGVGASGPGTGIGTGTVA